MKCIRCGHDSKHKDRIRRTCPQCKGRFAFEPQDGDPVTDMLFQNAIAVVSGDGRIRWGVEHLYYEVNRRKRPRVYSTPVAAALAIGGIVFALAFFAIASMSNLGFLLVPLGLVIGGILLFLGCRTLFGGPFAIIPPNQFAPLWDRWCETHGTPSTVIQRSPEIASRHKAAQSSRTARSDRTIAVATSVPVFGKRGAAADAPIEPDLADYSFDRAVICDRARTADLLIANNFHFENNCAILSIDGYPENVFDTVKAMIKRNPRLHVFALHDASPEGCRLASTIAYAPDWFNGRTLVVDLGLRPRHAKPFHGLLQPATAATVAGGGIDATEAAWLSRHTLELAAVRPEDVLKRLFRGIQAHANDDPSSGGTSSCGSFDSHGNGSQGDSVDGADSFG